jgi:hypothetical protein
MALRFLAGLFLLAAAIVLASDLTQPLTTHARFTPTPMARHWADTAPRSLAAAKTAVAQRAGPAAWDKILAPVLQVPTFALLGGLGALCGYLGRRRRKVEIFTN